MTQKSLFFAEFWERITQEWAEYEKALLDWINNMDCEDDDEYEDDTEYCDYTGEECCGDKMFCEECSVLTGEWEE